MATNYTSLLGFALPTTGELANTWGQVVNDNITELVEDAIAATATAAVTSGDWTLSTTGSGAANEARCAILIPTGTPGVSRNIIAPSQSKAYVVINESNGAVVVKGSATTGVSIAAGAKSVVAWNGSDFVEVAASGDVDGPSSSTANAVVRFEGTTGKVIKNTGVTIDDSNNLSGVAQINATTADLTNVEVTNVKAKDGTSAATIADSTGVVTVAQAPVMTALTASQAVFTTSGKALVSNAITGTGNVVMSTSPTLTTPNLGTPSAVTLTNATGLPVATGISGLGSGVATFLATPSSANLAAAVTNETGTGSLVFSNSPTLVTPELGTPSSVTLTNATGLPTAGLVDNAVTNAKLRDSAALSVIGRSSNTSGDPADIAAASDHQVLRRSGTSIGFGAVALNQTNAITGTLPVSNGGSGATSLTGVLKGNGTSAFTASNVNLASEVTGTLPVGNGGTGQSSLTLNNVILGNDTSAVQLVAPSTSGNGLFSDGTTWASRAAVVRDTAQATTSGNTKDFTGIPSWVKKITIMFNGVSFSGGTPLIVQLGDSGGFESTGYAATSAIIAGTGNTVAGKTDGFNINYNNANHAIAGIMEIANVEGNTWCSSHSVRLVDGSIAAGGGVKTLSDPLTQVRIAGGTFDAGSVNIMYQ